MSALATIHVARKQLGIEDDDYRDLLERVTGKRSSAEMSDAERGKVLEEMRRLGFVSTSRPGGSNGTRRRLQGKYAGKLQALWIGAWNLGLVRDRSDAALISFVRRQTGIDHVRFVRHAKDAARAIEALKGWMARDADVDWERDGDALPHTKTSGYRIAWAQWLKCGPDAMPATRRLQFNDEIQRLTGRSVDHLINEADWHPVMNEFGRRIRAA
ncbi:MAG: regulatory protein GemA [Pseudomonadota bacterium]|nr:regulatory protein GemA [Pseudomonadota bacterium]